MDKIKIYRSKKFNYRVEEDGKIEFVSITLQRQYNRPQNEEILTAQLLRSKYWIAEDMHQPECNLEVVRERIVDQSPQPQPKKRKREELEDEEAAVNETDTCLGCKVDQMWHCSHPDCTAKFISPTYLKKHEASGGHYYGKEDSVHTNTAKRVKNRLWTPPQERINLVKVNDRMLLGIQEYQNQLSTASTPPSLPSPSQPIQVMNQSIEGEKFFFYGMAQQQSNHRSNRSVLQLRFIRDWLKLGEEKGSNKVSPEQAAIMMKKMGTPEGQRLFPRVPWMKTSNSGHPNFKLKERLNSYTLRQYLSRKSVDIQAIIDKSSLSLSNSTSDLQIPMEIDVD